MSIHKHIYYLYTSNTFVFISFILSICYKIIDNSRPRSIIFKIVEITFRSFVKFKEHRPLIFFDDLHIFLSLYEGNPRVNEFAVPSFKKNWPKCSSIVHIDILQSWFLSKLKSEVIHFFE